jgi:hypothetical protein
MACPGRRPARHHLLVVLRGAPAGLRRCRRWRPTPPPGTAALAVLPGATTDALAVTGATLTIYQLTAAGTWSRPQSVKIPIQYGSSG